MAIKVAVTGASGFIGKHVIRELLKRKVNITAVTRNKNSLLEFKDDVEIIELDIYIVRDDMFGHLGKPDILIHLAWGGLPNYKSTFHLSKELPAQLNFLETVIKGGLKSLLITGTCFEYGMQTGCLSESDDTKPSNSYGLAKNNLRKKIEELKLEYSFNLVWTRLFYIFGEGQGSSAIYSQIKKAIHEGEKVFNMSLGEQIRDYLPVEEVANYLVRLILLNKDIGIVNVSSGEPLALKSVVKNWVEINRWNIKLNFGYYPYSDHEPMNFWGSNVKCKSLLRFF